MHAELDRMEREFRAALASAGTDLRAVEQVRVRFLGRRGELTALLKALGALRAEDRPAAGKSINDLKERIIREVSGAAARA